MNALQRLAQHITPAQKSIETNTHVIATNVRMTQRTMSTHVISSKNNSTILTKKLTNSN